MQINNVRTISREEESTQNICSKDTQIRKWVSSRAFEDGTRLTQIFKGQIKGGPEHKSKQDMDMLKKKPHPFDVERATDSARRDGDMDLFALFLLTENETDCKIEWES